MSSMIFTVLTKPRKCPPSLLTHLNYLSGVNGCSCALNDARRPGRVSKQNVLRNMDFSRLSMIAANNDCDFSFQSTCGHQDVCETLGVLGTSGNC